jgi:hypothetical protein
MANNKKKGDRREREAVELLEKAGWAVETPNSTPYPQKYGVDFFGLFDFMAFKDGHILFGQVKANGARGITTFSEECLDNQVPLEADNVTVEFWVCYDYKGWRIDEVNLDSYETIVDERELDVPIGQEVVEYKR